MSNLTSSSAAEGFGNRYRLLVYDLDGTLLETLQDLAEAIQIAFHERGWDGVAPSRVRAAIGDGARSLIQRLLPREASESDLDPTLERFRLAYQSCCCDHSTWLPGVELFLERRAKERPDRLQAILTNKPQTPTDRLVGHLGMDRWITRAIGGDTPHGKKPDPGGLQELMRWAGVEANETLMIGDGPADLEVARSAGVEAVLLTGGYGQAQELEGLPAMLRVEGLQELERLWGGARA